MMNPDLVWPAVVEWGASPAAPLEVGSWPFEMLFIDSQRCACGGKYVSGPHHVYEGEPALECHRVRCGGCGRKRWFWFDIGSFHRYRRMNNGFETVRGLFKRGLDLVESGELPRAQECFREVAAREPWFGLAHYHLGMIAMVVDDLDRAQRCLETAAGILPMDPAVHSALAAYWALTEEAERARRALAVADALRAFVDGPSSEE